MCALAHAWLGPSASVPGSYKEQLWGCLASLNPGAGPVAAPRSPRGNLPTTPHPRRTSSTLGLQPAMPQVIYQVQDSLALPPGRPSLRILTLKEITVVLFLLFFDFCLFNCHTHVLVISPTLYYVISRNIISVGILLIYYFVILLTYSMLSTINRFAIIM